MADTPLGATVTLRPHQRALLHRCLRMEFEQLPVSEMPCLRNTAFRGGGSQGDVVRTRIGIIGDRVGSGKSYVVLALVAAALGRAPEPYPMVKTYGGGRITFSQEDDGSTSMDITLLVIPHNLCAQWEGYLAAFPMLRSTVVSRTKHLEVARQSLANLDLLVVTNSFYSVVAAWFSAGRRKVRRVVYDEADTIMMIPSTAHVDASFYWFVTASYPNLLHPHPPRTRDDASVGGGVRSSGFLRALFVDIVNSLARELVRALVVRSDDAFVRQSMDFPDPVVEHVLCRTPRSISMLRGVVDRTIIECLNAGDLPAALQHISPANKNTEDNIVAVLIEKSMRQVKNMEARIALVPTLLYENEAERDTEMQRLVHKKTELETTVTAIRNRVAESDMCCICYDDIVNKAVAPCCSNAYCFGCITRWVAGAASCPLCKGGLGAADLLLIQTSSQAAVEQAQQQQHAHTPPDKLDALEHILRTRFHPPSSTAPSTPSTAAKVLVFSAYDQSFVGIEGMLNRLGVRYGFLRGNHFHIRNMVERYKNGDVDLLLVNPTHYGSGLNFENTTDIVMYHRVDTEVEKQVIGRALRMGRTTSLKTWYLEYENEVRTDDSIEVR
jgi:hypothetical protein